MTHSYGEKYRAFWFDFGLPRAKVALFRLAFFALVGLDGVLQLSHAPRYGASGFNVGHLSWLQALLPEPSRPVMVVLFVLQAYLGFRIALGAASKSAVWLLTSVYGYAYFASQLDSYQHHYLVFLLLVIGCFVPWDESAGKSDGAHEREGDDDGMRVVKSWALRLILVQIAIVYAWAAIAKLDGLWLDGTVLDKQLRPGMARDMAEWMGMGKVAISVVLAELFLAGALLIRRAWPVALVVGVGLHAAIEFGAQFRIGIFSYYMFAMYTLLVPDAVFAAGVRVWRAFSHAVRWAAVRGAINRVCASTMAFVLVVAAALVAGAAVYFAIPLDQVPTIAGISTGLAAVAIIWYLGPWSGLPGSRGRQSAMAVALAHVAACIAISALAVKTDAVGDYYKYWGGSARRMGHWDEAESAYTRLTRLRPDWASGHYHLARIAQRDNRLDQALEGYRRAQEANPEDYRAFLQEAVIHDSAGRGAQALAAARRALELIGATPRQSRSIQRDGNRARALIQRWQ